MAYYCCVPLCDKICEDGTSMHLFPLYPKVYDKWKKALEEGGEIQFPEATRMVCSSHFKSSDFFKNSHKRRRLKRNAVPSIFAWTSDVEQKVKFDSEGPKPLDCEVTLPGSVEILNCPQLIKVEEPLIPDETSYNLLVDPLEAIDIKHEPIGNPDLANTVLQESTEPIKILKQNTVKRDLLELTNHEPIKVKIIKQSTIKRDLLESTKHVPIDMKRLKSNTANKDLHVKKQPFNVSILNPGTTNTDLLVPTKQEEKVFKHELEVTDTFLSDSSVSTKYILPTVDNEFVKIVDIQDIVNQNSNQLEVSEMGTDTPVSSNSNDIILQSPIDITSVNGTSNLCEPKNVKSFPDQTELTDLVKNGACLRYKECKRIVSYEEQYTCSPRDNNFKCTICNSLFLAISDLQNHLASEHPNVQNTMGTLFLPNTSSGENFWISQMPEIGQQSIFSQFELVKAASINTSKNDSEKSSSERNYCISEAHDELYKHFCQFHLNIDDKVTLNKTVFLPPQSGDTFHCPHCTKIFKTTDEFATHLRIDHILCITYQCRNCQFIQNCRLDKFLEHLCPHADDYLKPHTIYQCEICEKLSNEITNLNNEQKYHEFCFYFKMFEIIRLNVPNGVYFRYTLKLPPRRFDPPKGFSCFCSEKFVSQDELNRHLENHVDCVFRKCSVCDLECENMYVYYKHIEQEHGNKLLDDLDFRSQKVKLFINEFACENQECMKTHVNNCSLQLHVRQQHTSHLGLHTIDIMDELKCPICQVVFLDQKLFYAHCVPYTPLIPELWDIQKPDYIYRFWCKICKMSQNSVKDLDDHVVKEHNVAMIHCVLCKSNFLCEKQAFSHFNSCYSKTTSQLNCPICGSICLSVDSMINHIRSELRIQLRQQCKFCLNFFYAKFNLALHMMNAKCNLCDLYFCNVKNLAEHHKVVHGC